MSDVVVTVPKALWTEWLTEGDLAYTFDLRNGNTLEPMPARPRPWDGEHEYGFNLGGHRPVIHPAERVYIVAHGRLRGYSPLIELSDDAIRFGGREDQWTLVRRGGAVACTIPEPVRGFQGWRYRWWDLTAEAPFPEWRTENVPSTRGAFL